MNKYINEYKKLHEQMPSFGSGACMYIDEVSLIIDELKPKTVLDYGCGKGNLISKLSKKYPNITFYGYDPAIKAKEVLPTDNVDLVINTDVLEHIPEDELTNVMSQIASISPNAFFWFTPCTGLYNTSKW